MSRDEAQIFEHNDDAYEETEIDPELPCRTCSGDGFVDSVAQTTGRYGWDDDGPGDCPNCGGSGLRKDCRWF